MAIKIETTINNYLRLPVSDMPSNQPYQPKKGNTEEVAARSEVKRAFLSEGATKAWPTLDITAIIDGLKAGVEDEEAFAAKRTSSYGKVLRMTRGRAMDTRDLSYRIGDHRAKEAILAIKELPAEQHRDKLRTYFMAQYDPTSIDDSVRFETEEMS